MKQILDGNGLVLGTCYYPEHWDRSLWRDDLERMKECGIEVIRIAEFAWNKIEPREGEFIYSFFDEFLDLVEEVGDIKVIFCTPTATPPAWLTEKYPETLNTDINGIPYRHGSRRQYTYNSPVYQQLSARIVEKSASHYAGRKCIIGWQIDNELNNETNEFYSESDTKAFRVYLQNKYETLDALNEAWGTAFWNQTYSDWNEVYVPGKTTNNSVNPHQVMEFKRFISESCRRYVKMQSDILRKYLKPGDFLTTNGMFGNLDNHQMTEESLDFYTYDSYPNFANCLEAPHGNPRDLKDRNWSRNLSEARSVSPAFGIMEQQSGPLGFNTCMESPAPRPGQMSLWTMQSVAHGADFVSYFRWRTSTIGTEIYWHGILDYSGRENRRIREVRKVHQLFRSIDEIAGSRYEARVAVAKDYDNSWDAELDVWHRRVEWASQQALFEAATRTHTPMDYIYMGHTDLETMLKYQVIFCPHPTIMTRDRAELLTAYAEAGGTVVFGCRSAYKDTNGRCVTDRLPGLLSELTGTDIPEYSFIAADSDPVMIDWNGTMMEASVFTDLLEPIGNGIVEGTFTSDYFEGSGALISNKVGKGKAYYYGTAWNEASARVFLEKLGVADPYSEIVEVPECCEIAVRAKGDVRYLFILNYSGASVSYTLKTRGTDLCTGEAAAGERGIAAYGTAVIRI